MSRVNPRAANRPIPAPIRVHFIPSRTVIPKTSHEVAPSAMRTPNSCVRIALGATSWDVLGMTVREGMKWTLMGAGIGLFAALGLTRLMASLLYGVCSHDPATFGLVVFVILGVALLASYVPARRAMYVDPMVALRYE